MAIVNPSTAVIAKARAKYGKRLKNKDFAAMSKASSVGEIVQYLKSYTYYREFLNKVSGNDVHRGNVEQILRKELFNHFLSLCRYNKNNSPVTAYILRQTEINEIMKYLTLLSIGRPEEYLFAMPLYFNEHTEIELEKFSKSRTYSDFLRTLKNTEYRSLLKDYAPAEDDRIDLAAIEDCLQVYSYRELYASIHKIKDKKEKAILKELFDTVVDYNTFSRIIRLKKYYHMDNAAIREHLIPYGTLTSRRLDKILAKENYDDILSALLQTNIGKKIKNKNFDFEGSISAQGRFDICRHHLYFSTSPEAVLLSYYLLTENELRNVIIVIEGVRYSLPQSSIMDMLILPQQTS